MHIHVHPHAMPARRKTAWCPAVDAGTTRSSVFQGICKVAILSVDGVEDRAP